MVQEIDLPLDTSLLDPEVLQKIGEGEYTIAGPGQREGKPVVVNAATGRWVKGSGRPLNANDPATVGKVHGFKHSRKYNEALESFIPADKDGSDFAILSLEELLVAARSAVIDVVQFIEAQCPACDQRFKVESAGKPDAKVLTFLIERLVGAAKKTEEVNVHSEEVVRIMNDTRVLHQIEVVSLTPEERAARKRAIIEADL